MRQQLSLFLKGPARRLDDVPAGICTNAQVGRRLLDLNGLSFLLQPFPQFTGGLNVFDSSDYSNYAGLQFIFKRRVNKGLGFQFGYTLSKSKDNRSWDPSLSTVSSGSVQSASSTPFDLRDRSLNYTWSDFDRRHVFQGTYTYELPFGKGKSFWSGMPASSESRHRWLGDSGHSDLDVGKTIHCLLGHQHNEQRGPINCGLQRLLEKQWSARAGDRQELLV